MFLSRFDGQSRLLVRSLLSGVSGAHGALGVFQKQQRVGSQTTLYSLIETLCQEEITCPVSEAQLLTVKPLVCLFPALFKQNLLSFIHLVHSFLPRATVFRLLDCLSHDSPPNPWVVALVRQLGRTLSPHREEPLYSPLCSQRLLDLSQHLGGCGEVRGWTSCFSGQMVSSPASQSALGSSELGTQRKRTSSFITLESDSEEAGQQSKRMKMDLCGNEGRDAGDQDQAEDTSGILEGASTGLSAEAKQPSPNTPCDSLPEHMKVSVLQIKELLDNQAEWDPSSTDVFKVLNDCDPTQVEVLCRMLSLADLPEQTLPKLCSSVLALSPDLSYSTVTTLLKSLLLNKVQSLSEPASRCLLGAVTSLCGSYPRPMCHAVIGPLLHDKNIGNPQAELLNRLIENCLDPHYRLVMLQMTFEIQWNEAVLSIIHSLLDSKPDLHEELFTQFTKQLVSQAPQFTKSVKFAKMMLIILTKYSSHVTAAHRNALSSCLTLNETFLKKPLEAALKRIPHT